MVVAGNITFEQVKQLAKKWFEPIPAGQKPQKLFGKEAKQTEARQQTIEAKVPVNVIYKAYHMPGRYDADFHTIDLFSDVLGRGKSSVLHEKLVTENPVFSSLSAYVNASLDPGLLLINGNLNEGITFEQADSAICEVVNNLLKKGITDSELEKVKNQSLTTQAFSEVDLLNRAMTLAFSANAGNIEYANLEATNIEKVNKTDLIEKAKIVMREDNCSTIFYKAVS